MTTKPEDALVERLRTWPATEQGDALNAGFVGTMLNEAADAITTLLERERRATEALSDDECVICGKKRYQHTTNSGVGMCQIYPIFRSKRAAFLKLQDEARAALTGMGDSNAHD